MFLKRKVRSSGNKGFYGNGFSTSPQGEETDLIDHTLCYDEVCKMVRDSLSHKEFHLIEKMGRDCLVALREKIPKTTLLQVTLHKVQPPIKDLLGGVQYICGDVLTT